MAGHREVGLGEIAWAFLRLGAIGFGGPTAHIALMEEEVVRRRRWLTRDRFLDALGVTNLIPGPNSSELAIHTGYVVGGQAGALVAGVCFLAPAAVLMTALSAAYFSLGGFTFRADLFAGLQAVVIAVIAVTVWRLREAFGDMLGASLGAAAMVLTVVLPRWEPVWLVGAGMVTLARWAMPTLRPDQSGAVGIGWTLRAPLLAGGMAGAVAGASALPALALVFLRTGALLFGGGYVLIPLLQPEMLAHGWLTRAQFLDGIALGQATPGPIVTTSAFVGYGVAGIAGAAVATAAIYLPAFVAVMAGTGPFLRAFRERPAVRAFVRGVTAAAVGAIAGAGVILSKTGLRTPLRAVIFAAALVALARKVPIWVVLPAGAALSVVVAALS